MLKLGAQPLPSKWSSLKDASLKGGGGAGRRRVVLSVIWLWEPQILIFGHELFYYDY